MHVLRFAAEQPLSNCVNCCRCQAYQHHVIAAQAGVQLYWGALVFIV